MKDILISLVSIVFGCGVISYALTDTRSILQGLAGAFLVAGGCALARRSE